MPAVIPAAFKRVKDPADIPSGPHYAVIVYDRTSVHIPGDERSRTHPGHGYPAHIDTYDTFEHWVSTDERAVKEFLVNMNSYKGKLKPFVVLRVEGKATVSFEPKVQW